MKVYTLIYHAFRRVSLALAHGATILLIGMFVVVVSQVVCRYAFGSPIPWAEELAVYLMVFMTYLCLPHLVITNGNISMSLFYDKFKGTRMKSILDIFFCGLMIFVIVSWLPEAINIYQKNRAVTAYQLPITRGQLYSVIPFSLSVSMFAVILKLIQALACLVNPSAQEKFTLLERRYAVQNTSDLEN